MVSVETLLREKLHRVLLMDADEVPTEHFYWIYNRWTLCGRDKTHAQRLWFTQGNPVCLHCEAVVGRVALEAARKLKVA
jgi:hypothetical protein